MSPTPTISKPTNAPRHAGWTGAVGRLVVRQYVRFLRPSLQVWARTLGPIGHRLFTPTVRWYLLIFGVGFAALVPLDQPVYRMFAPIDTGEEDWHRMFRIVGFAPMWLIVAAAIAMVDLGKRRMKGLAEAAHRAVLLAVSVLAAAGLAEVMKLIARRERPNMHDGLYIWRDWSDQPWHSGGIGLPSSHTAVAFAAAWALCHVFPAASPVWLFLAIGCAATRVINHSHFLTDVWTSALLSFAIVRTLWWWHQTHRRPLEGR